MTVTGLTPFEHYDGGWILLCDYGEGPVREGNYATIEDAQEAFFNSCRRTAHNMDPVDPGLREAIDAKDIIACSVAIKKLLNFQYGFEVLRLSRVIKTTLDVMEESRVRDI